MKSNDLLLLVIMLLISSTAGAQYWTQKESDTLYYESPVIIGNNVGESAMLSLVSQYNEQNGGGYGMISKHSTNNAYLNFKTRSRIGYSSNWAAQSQGAAFSGALYLNKDNASRESSHSAGGVFVLEFDDYSPYDYSDNIHYLAGSYNTIRGNISNFPTNSAISAVIGKDQLNTKSTYAGYFEGKGYFSDNVGIGTKQPSSKLEVADGDIYISDIDKGIIMKSPDGNCWRGVLNNLGQLTFSKINCPEETLQGTNIVNDRNREAVNSLKVYPNPSEKEVVILAEGYDANILFYSLFDMSGKLLKTSSCTNASSIDISFLSSGVYLIKVSDSKGQSIGNKKINVL